MTRSRTSSGPPPDSRRAPAPDESVAHRVNGERLVLLGWGRAILMQLAHPLVAEGVAAHSSFQQSRIASLRRLHSTISAALALTFGTPDEAARSAAGINRIHDRVHGRLPTSVGRHAAGTPYSAHDPALLTWVELTLLESLPLAYDLFVQPLTDGERDAWCREARTSVRLLGLDPDVLPDRFDAVQAAVRDRLASGDIVVGDTARRLADGVLHPPFARLTWPWSRLNRLATIGLLPPAVRAGYSLEWTDADARSLARWGRLTRTAAAWTPDVIRRWRIARRRG